MAVLGTEDRAIERRLIHQSGAAHYLVRVAPYRDADRRVEGAVVTFIDITSLTAAERHHETLIAELNHRVKNMLAVIIGLAQQTGKNAPSADDFRQSLVDRLQAMARSYELLSRENWKSAALEDLVRKELTPFDLSRVAINGPALRLSPRRALSLGMILHELATNAAKYGALASPQGKVSISW